ncbi:LPS assembly protein LptD [Vibrio tubiashii]|uniref:phosphatase PAP2 family protein n=1 Tax=Vibrio tubiashii TaxID=29498 RepID=UPI00234F9448|nr:LPS assembly protein LptD [Vibrio tubiashii]WCP69187.1 LPS assembly protein LptD [Vibrio tubiashii]
MKKLFLSAAVSCVLAQGTAFANPTTNAITSNTDDDYVVAGDYIQVALPLTGLFAAWLHDDAEGAKQLTYSLATTIGIVQAGKYVVGRVRPNSSNTASFPSGHTAAAFSGAAFLQSRYGAKWGLPAYAAASFVGASRVHGNRHYADDVVAGAGIAFLTNQFFVSEYTPEGVNLSAAPLKDGMMLNVSLTNDAFEYDSNRKRANPVYAKKKVHSFTLDIGFNTYDTMGDLGANQTIENSAPVDEYQPFSRATYAYQLSDDSAIEFQIAPNETRRTGKVSGSFEIDNNTYTQGEDIFIALRQWSAGGLYQKQYQVSDAVSLTAGAGLYAYLLDIETDLLNGGRHSKLSSTPVLPAVSGEVEYAFNDKWSVMGRVDYQIFDRDRVFASETGVNYKVNPDWTVALKYAYTNNNWEMYQTRYRSESVLLSVTNRF